MVPIAEAAIGRYSGFVAVMGTQMGKTDGALNIMGHRLDDEPVPLIYIAPSRHFAENKFEPRLVAMIDSAATLRSKLSRGKSETKTQKRVSGVTVSLAWAGSASSVAGDPAGLVIIDERDRMVSNVAGEGDPVELGVARSETYIDGKTGVFSTPTTGTVKVEKHPETGLIHWAIQDDPEQMQSPTWALWQEGTRHEYMVPCPDCGTYFAPRFRLLSWPDDLEPGQLDETNVLLCCPHCGVGIPESGKLELLARGKAIAPGQSVGESGEIVGEGPLSDWFSIWVSGLLSPWRSWSTSARRYVRAARQGSSEKMQAVINTCFGELWSVSGDAPPAEEVAELRSDYVMGEVPDGAYRLVMGVDVQKNRLVYVVRAFSRYRHLESWLIEHGEIFGETNEPEVWEALEAFRSRQYGGFPVHRCFIDQKYRSPHVFAFCRRNTPWAFPAAGWLPRSNTPDQETALRTSQIEVDVDGKLLRKGTGLTRWTCNTDYFKRWIHDRIAAGPEADGAFRLPIDASDEYCNQLVAEGRAVTASGRVFWQRRRRDNHYLDCEMLCIACAHSLRLQHYAEPPKAPADTPRAPRPPAPRGRGGNWTTGFR